jgi:hypothetical protein
VTDAKWPNWGSQPSTPHRSPMYSIPAIEFLLNLSTTVILQRTLQIVFGVALLEQLTKLTLHIATNL